MVIMIHLQPDTERRLSARATAAGLTVEQYVQQLVDRAGSFEQVTDPVARAIDASGMSEQEVEDFFTNAVREVRAARRYHQDTSPEPPHL